jgi:hypothetical protein
MRPSSRLRLPVFLLVLGVALPALAYEYPLSSTAIRDAYFVGKRTSSRGSDYFQKYTHYLPTSDDDAHVEAISLETPFVQVAQRSGAAFNYYAQDAEREFTDKELPLRVLVTVDLAGAYPQSTKTNPHFLGSPVPDFWSEFDVQLIQEKAIPAKSRRLYLMYSDASADINGISGAVLELDYDAEPIDSTETTIKVETADGQHAETTFDLSQLR